MKISPNDMATTPSNLSDTSRAYLNENINAFLLERREHTYNGQGKNIQIATLKGICLQIEHDLRRGSIEYLKAIILGWRELYKLSLLKNTKANRKVIVIGNGPSQEYIKPEVLKEFKKNGNDIFTINYWNKNNIFSTCSPTHFVTSDPYVLREETGSTIPSYLVENNKALKERLLNDMDIFIFSPVWQVKSLLNVYGPGRVCGYIDGEMRSLNSNIDPRFPRGYVSMTLYKALALAIHMGYQETYLIGMDNTYPRDIFCDNNNKILRRERHAGGGDYMIDITKLIPSMDVQMQDIFNLFYDLRRCFQGVGVINLDPYSLTDVFQKITKISEIDDLLTSDLSALKVGQYR